MTDPAVCPRTEDGPLEIRDSTGPAARTLAVLATDPAQLAEMLESFRAAGFGSDDTRILIARNFGQNHFDGYSGIAAFIDEARGGYLVFAHQDVRAIDPVERLEAALAALSRLDPGWALAGNAGYRGVARPVMRISDPWGEDQRLGPFPAKVETLDENLLILSLAAPVRPSPGLEGFHFYGTDLCLQAGLAGRAAYVVDWHVRHLSGGQRSAAWHASVAAIEAAYDGRLGTRVVATPTTLLFFGIFRVLRPARMLLLRLSRRIERARRRRRASA